MEYSKCNNCGNPVSPQYNICPHCGTSQNTAQNNSQPILQTRAIIKIKTKITTPITLKT